MEEKANAVVTLGIILLALIGLGMWSWSTLPQHQAAADRTAALTPYLEQQALIETQEMAAETQLRVERANKVQWLKTLALGAVFALIVAASAYVGSYGAVYTYQKAQRTARQARLPVTQAVGDNFILLGDGQNAFLLNTVTNRVETALTAVTGDETYAEIMGRILITRELAAGAEAVARHSKDGAVGDYLMGQVQRVTDETINESTRIN